MSTQGSGPANTDSETARIETFSDGVFAIAIKRTFSSWIDHNRRMSKDYERLTETSEAFIYVAMSRLMVKRLARS